MTHQSKLHNTICCTLAAFIASCVIFRAGLKYAIGWLSFSLQLTLILLAVLATVTYTIIKNRKANKEGANGNAFFAFWHSALRYFLAIDLISFALQKVFHLQFVIPLGKLDTPFSEMKSDDLLWAFFGKYYSYTLIIAGMQALGAILLLFRRTWLVGVFVLLPILFSILLLNWYYWISLVVTIYITTLTAGAVYLLFTEYDRLAEFFFKANSNLPALNIKSLQKNLIRVSAILIPALCISTIKFPKQYPEILGKYIVKKLLINDSLQTAQPCRDSILTKIFIDKYDFVLQYNNDYKRIVIGSYSYNEATRELKAIWRYPRNQHDTLVAKILPGADPDKKILSGRMGKQLLKIDLQRVNKGN